VKNNTHTGKSGLEVHRRGSVFPVFVISLLLVTATAAALIRTVLTQRSLIRSGEVRIQTEWLIQSGIAKAAAGLAADPAYRGEVWSIPADQLRNTFSARIQIEVVPPGQNPAPGETAAGSDHEINLTVNCSSEDEQLSRLSRRIVMAGPQQQEP